MADINFFKGAIPSKEGVAEYDKGKTPAQAINDMSPSYEKIFKAPASTTASSTRMPVTPTQPESQVKPEDGKYGFIEQDTFDPIDIMEGYESPVGYDSGEAAMQAAIMQGNVGNNFDLLGVGDYHSQATKLAAANSDFSSDKNYSAVGKLTRSIVAGVGSQLFTATADVVDWIDSVGHMATGVEDQGRSIYDEANPDGTPYQRGEDFASGANPAMIAANAFEYFTGIDMLSSFTDVLRSVGNALETVDDDIEEQFKDEHGGNFVKFDEEGNPKVDYSQLLVADFWLTKVAKQIPNMAMFALTGGLGGAAAAAATTTRVGSVIGKTHLAKGALAVGKKVLGSKFTGQKAARFFGQGLGANLSEGAVLAGDAHKQALEQGLTSDQAAIVGLQVMRDNAKYMMIDAIQYSIFDKGLGMIPAGMRKASKMKLGTGVTFKNSLASFMVGSGQAVASGKMEEFQEIYQDWRVQSNLALMKGEEPQGYWDYYHDPKHAETRLVSFGMGFGMGSFGVVKSVVSDAAVTANIIDEKIEASGFDEGGSGLFFVEALEKLKNQEKTGEGPYSQEEITINKKHKVIENAILGSVVNGDVQLGKERIEHLVQKEKLTRQEGDAAIKLMDDMAESYESFQNANLKGMPTKYRKEVARLAYNIAMEKKVATEVNQTFESQIEAVKNDNTRKEADKKVEIEKIKAEQQTAQEATSATIESYQEGIKQVRKDALNDLQEQSDAIDAKNQQKKDDKQQDDLSAQLEEQDMEDARNEERLVESRKLDTKNRKQKIKELEKQIEESEVELPEVQSELTALKQAQKEENKANKKRKKELKTIQQREQKKKKRKSNWKQKKEATKKRRQDKMHSLNEDSKQESKTTEDTYQLKVNGEVINTKRNYGIEAIFRERLKKKGINLMVYSHFAKTKNGMRYWGLSQGLSIYLNADKATQETYFHELAHVYLMEFWDSPSVKALKKIVLNQPVFKQAKELYRHKIMFKGGKNLGDIVFESDNILTDKAYLKKNPNKTKSDYIDYVIKEAEKKGLEVLPDAEQRVILEESVVALIAKSKTDQDLNSLIDTSKSTRVKNNLKKFWRKAKGRLTKEDSEKILKETGNEQLVNNKQILQDVLNDYNAQLEGKDGKFEFRRDREGLDGKMAHIGEEQFMNYDNGVASIVKQELGSLWREEGFQQEIDSEIELHGKPLAATKKRYIQWVKDNMKNIDERMDALYNGDASGANKAIDQYQMSNYESKGNRRQYFNEIVFEKLGAREAEKVDEEMLGEEFNVVDMYLETRNKENEKLSKWAKEFARLAPVIDGVKNLEREARRALWTSIHIKDSVANKNQFIENAQILIKEFDTKGAEQFRKDRKISEEVLVRYLKFVEQTYKNNNWETGDNMSRVLAHLHHEISGYKRINWLSYYMNENGKSSLNPHKGAQVVLGEAYSKSEESRRKDIENVFQNEFKDSVRFNTYLKDIVALEQALKNTNNNRQKRELVANFIYDNLTSDIVKENIEAVDLMDTDAVTNIVEDNALKLIQETSLFRVDGAFNKYKNRLKKLKGLGQKSLDRDTKLQRYGAVTLKDGRTQRADKIDVKKIGGFLPTLNSVAKSVTQALAFGQFDSMVKMPGGEMTANISKTHQIDTLIKQIDNLYDTPGGKERLKALFPDNHIIKRLLMNGTKPDIRQVIGGNIYIDGVRKGFDSNGATANEMAALQIGEILSAIKGGKQTYSQSISIFSDKSIDLHLNNAPLYNLTQAQRVAKKLFKGDANKFAKDAINLINRELAGKYKELENLSGPQIEQIALNYAINKYYAKDLFIGPKKYYKPGFSDYIKRAAGSVAMSVGIGSDVRLEPIMLKDVEQTIKVDGKDVKINMTDAASFILPENAEMIREKYGEARNVGKHFKFVYYGQNLDNTTFESQVGSRHPFYLKTNTFVLTDKFVEDNPKFATLRDALRVREVATQGSAKKTLPMIVFRSANKVLGSKETGIDSKLKSVEELQSMMDNDTFNEFQDELFAFEDTNGNLQYGLDGSNLGIQTELDKRADDASVSKQLNFMFYSNPELIDQANNIMESLISAYEKKTKAVFSKFGSTRRHLNDESLTSILENVFDKADIDTYGSSVIDLLKSGSLDSGTLGALRNIVKSNIIREAIKTRGPGGLGVQSTDYGIRIEGRSVDGLNHYKRNEETGDVEQNADIVLDASTARRLKLKVNDEVIVQRIPTSKLGDGVVCTVQQITRGMGTMAAISSVTSDILGSDLDGDALHIIGRHPKDRTGKVSAEKQLWNDAFENMTKFLKDGRNKKYTEAGINELETVIKNLNIKESSLNDLSLLGNRDTFISNIGSGAMIGVSATYNNGHKILSAGNAAGHELNLTLFGKKVGRSYKDSGNAWLNLAYVLNMFLDNANKGYATMLNLNEHTFGLASELISRNVSLTDVIKTINNPSVKALVKQAQLSGSSITAIARETVIDNLRDDLGENASYKDFINRNLTSINNEVDAARLILKTNDFASKQSLDAIRELASLDTNLKETAVEGVEMIDSLITLATGARKMRDKPQGDRVASLEKIGEDGVNVSEIISTESDLKTLKEKLYTGDVNFIKNNVTFTNPMLQRNFETLLKAVDNQRKIDPAYTGSYYQVINKIFPLNSIYNSKLLKGVPLKKMVEGLKSIESRVRTSRLMQSDAYKNINPSQMLSNILNTQVVDAKNEAQVKEESKKTDVHDNSMPLVYTMNRVLEHIYSLRNESGYEFIKFLHIKKVANPQGYFTYKGEGDVSAIKIKDGQPVLENVSHKTGTEYVVSPNAELLKTMRPQDIAAEFNKLPKDVQEFLYLYDLIKNNHSGPATLRPYLHGDMRKAVTKATRQNVLNSKSDLDSGALSKVSVEQLANDALINNKEYIFDATENIRLAGIRQNMSVQKDGKTIVMTNQSLPYNSVVKVNLPSSSGNMASVLYNTSMVEKTPGAIMLTPIDNSVLRDKTIPSNEAPVRDSRTKGKMFMLEDTSMQETEMNKVLGKTKDGREIVDTDGRFGSTEMYQLVEEEDQFNSNMQKLAFGDYVRTKYNGADHNKLSDKDRVKVKEEYKKYEDDWYDVRRLENMYLKPDKMGGVEIEKGKYKVSDIYKIIKNKIYPLDEVARRKLYNNLVKVLAVKVSVLSIDEIVKSNPGLTVEEIEKIKQDRKKIKSGYKGFKDITYANLWLSPDVSTQERQEIAGMLRKIEEAETLYRRDLAKIQNKTEQAFDGLLKEKFGGKIIPWWITKFAYQAIPYVRHFKIMNKHIFGNLMSEVETDKDGVYYRVLKMKDFLNEDGTVSQSKMDNAELSQAEQDYYRMYVDTTGMFADHMYNKTGTDGQRVLKEKRDRMYIPNRAGGYLETMLARNMTATFIGFNYDSTLRGINVNGTNPLSGQNETKPLGQFINDYMIAQKGKGLSMSDYRMKNEIKALQRKAQGHLKTGIDAKGKTAFKVENVENLSTGENINRYLAGRSSNSEFLASYDIHTNLNKYIEKNLFAHGLDSKYGNAKGYSFKGAMELLPLIDGVIAYSSFKNNPLAKRWVKELYKDTWLFQKGKRSLVAKEGEGKSYADMAAEMLMKWTMFVGLALKPAVAVSNIAIGKINEYRRAGFTTMKIGEGRFWGEMKRSKGTRNNKVWGITNYYGLLADSSAQTTEGLFTGPIGNFLFFFMTGSEDYIQRTAFISQLTQKQWESFTMENGEIKVIEGREADFASIEKDAQQMKDNVYSVQGRGYTATDQRLMQNYFIINGLLQFKRWFPTFVMDRLGGERVDRFGKKQIGSLRMTGTFLNEMWQDGDFDLREIMRALNYEGKRFENLPEYQQEALKRAVRGGKATLIILAFMVLSGGFDGDDDNDGFMLMKAKQLLGDLFLLGNPKRLHYMAAPPMLATGKNVTDTVQNFFSNSKYQRDTTYFEKGQPKYKGNFIKLMPQFIKDLVKRKETSTTMAK